MGILKTWLVSTVFIGRMLNVWFMLVLSAFQLQLLLFETLIFSRAAITWYFLATSSSLHVFQEGRLRNI